MKKLVQIWRDKHQTRFGLPILWVVYVEGNLVKQTINADDPHTNYAEAVLFASKEAERLGATLEPEPKEV